MERIVDRATERCLEIARVLIESSHDSRGIVFGSSPMDREARIVKYLEDEEAGVLVHLAVIAPTLAAQRARQFERDIRDAGLMEEVR